MPGLEHAHFHRRRDSMLQQRDILNPFDDVNSALNGIMGSNNDDGGKHTAVSIVYVTAAIPSSLSGANIAWSTVGVGPSSTAEVQPSRVSSAERKSSAAAPSSTADSAQASSAVSTAQTTQTPATTAQTSLTQSLVTPSSNAASSTASSSATATPEDTGLSGGAKAGIAFAVIIGVAALAAAIFFFMKRKKMQNEQEEISEKSNPFSDNATAPAPMAMNQAQRPTNSPAPFPMRPINPPAPAPMRPINPNMAAPAMGGAALGVGAGAMAANSPRNVEPLDDPFGPQSELPASAPGTSHGLPPASEPVPAPTAELASANHDGQLPDALRVNSQEHDGMAAVGAGAIGLAVASRLAAATSGSESQSAVPKSPTGSTSSSAAGGVTGNNVHRCQLDFTPTMDDELGLRAGELVRMIHEYDDGWALCIRMDKSQQGVCPRTCLSASPVKPRAQPGPGGPGRPGPTPGLRTPTQRPESPAARGPNARNPIPNNGSPRPSGPNSPNRGPGPYPGSMGPQRPGPGMQNGPPRSMSPGPGMQNGAPRTMSPGPGMRNGPPRAGSPGPMRAGSPAVLATQRQRSHSSATLPQEARPSPGPSPMSASVSPETVPSNPTSPKVISRKPVGADS